MKPSKQKLNWSISRMRTTLETFAKLDSIDRWYVLKMYHAMVEEVGEDCTNKRGKSNG